MNPNLLPRWPRRRTGADRYGPKPRVQFVVVDATAAQFGVFETLPGENVPLWTRRLLVRPGDDVGDAVCRLMEEAYPFTGPCVATGVEDFSTFVAKRIHPESAASLEAAGMPPDHFEDYGAHLASLDDPRIASRSTVFNIPNAPLSFTVFRPGGLSVVKGSFMGPRPIQAVADASADSDLVELGPPCTTMIKLNAETDPDDTDVTIRLPKYEAGKATLLSNRLVAALLTNYVLPPKAPARSGAFFRATLSCLDDDVEALSTTILAQAASAGACLL